VIGPVGELDPAFDPVQAEGRAIDRLAGDPARNRAEPGSGLGRIGIDIFWQRLAEQPGIELERLAVGVDIGAGESGLQEGCSEGRRGVEQAIDPGILQPPELGDREPGLAQQAGRLDLAAMG
jgi:hypothetical protein